MHECLTKRDGYEVCSIHCYVKDTFNFIVFQTNVFVFNYILHKLFYNYRSVVIKQYIKSVL